MKIRKIMKAASPILLAGFIYQALNIKLTVKKYQLRSGKIESELRIVFLSDLHNNLYGDGQADLITEIANQKPDLVLLGGDFFDTVGSIEDTIELFKWLGNTYPTFFITGNHDNGVKGIKSIKDLVESYKVHFIEGRTIVIPHGSTTFTISGVTDSKRRRLFQRQLKQAGGRINPADYNILLSHRPEKTAHYEKEAFDLVLAGHSHGGQVRLPGLINGLYAPNQGFLPKYAGGQYELNNGTTMIVNRGLMTQHQRLPKIFNRPEIVVIDIIQP